MLPQLGTYAFFVPLYFAMQPFAHATKGQALPPAYKLWALPISFIGGFVIPSLALALPNRYTESLFSKETATLLWHIWPLYAFTAHYFLCWMSKHCLGQAAGRSKTAYRCGYTLAIMIAAIPHLMNASLSGIAYLSPGLLNADIAHSLLPGTLLLPPIPWPSMMANSLAQGCLWFLQWDFSIGGFATLLWSLEMHIISNQSHGTGTIIPILLGKTVLLCAFLGLLGASAALLWERQELAWGHGCVEASDKSTMSYQRMPMPARHIVN